PMFMRPSRCNCCVPPHFVPQRFAIGEPIPLQSFTMFQARRSLDTARFECPAADRRERSERGRWRGARGERCPGAPGVPLNWTSHKCIWNQCHYNHSRCFKPGAVWTPRGSSASPPTDASAASEGGGGTLEVSGVLARRAYPFIRPL